MLLLDEDTGDEEDEAVGEKSVGVEEDFPPSFGRVPHADEERVEANPSDAFDAAGGGAGKRNVEDALNSMAALFPSLPRDLLRETLVQHAGTGALRPSIPPSLPAFSGPFLPPSLLSFLPCFLTFVFASFLSFPPFSSFHFFSYIISSPDFPPIFPLLASLAPPHPP